MPHPSIHILTTLPAQISLYKIIVTPVVAYLSDPASVLPLLKANPDEVDEIFDWRLDAFLDPGLVEGCIHETRDIPWVSDTQWREHTFQRPPEVHASRRSARVPAPIKGLTADILVSTERQPQSILRLTPIYFASLHRSIIDPCCPDCLCSTDNIL